ncbi:MAG: hypothetical protein OXC07_00360 [Kistimonas sp.]|nr:hypothetical protein [Kistimonas sp.]
MDITRPFPAISDSRGHNRQEQPPPTQASGQAQHSRASNAGATQPGSLPEHDGQQVTVSIKGRLWYVAPANEPLVRECHLCMNEVLADTSTCGHIRHRVCKTCFDAHVESGPKPTRCPNCNLEIATHDTCRDQVDRGLNALRQQVALQCAECNQAPVTPDQVEAHIQVCGETKHGCSHAAQGCDWEGLLEDKNRHEKLCDWRSVPCSHAPCTQQLIYCQRDEHETHCLYQPASMGSLQTTRGTLLQLQAAHLFFQQYPGEALAALPEPAVRKQLQEQAQLFPLLFEAVQQTTAVPARPCGFGCAPLALASASQTMPEHCTDCGALLAGLSMPAHREECPRRPLNCCWCLEQHPREEFATCVAACRQAAAAFARRSWPVHHWSLQGNAQGPVYDRKDQDEGSVMIRLPKAPLVRAMAGLPGATHSLRFHWKPMDCQLSVSFQKDSNNCIPVDINFHVADNSIYQTRLPELRTDDGDWLQNLKEIRCSYLISGHIMLIKDDRSARFLIQLSDSLADTPHSCVCFLLPPLRLWVRE